MRRTAAITNNFAFLLGNCVAGRNMGRMLPQIVIEKCLCSCAGIQHVACPCFCEINVTLGENLLLRCCFVCLLSLLPIILVLSPAWLVCSEMLLLLLRGDDG